MPKLRKRTTVDPRVRDYIEQEARFDREATYRVLAATVKNRMRKEGIAPLPALPKPRAIQVIAQKARKNPAPSPDDPWSLGVTSDFPPDATGDLLAAWKESLKAQHRFTIRNAKWIVRLRTALPGGHPSVLLKWAVMYSGRETYWEREQKGKPLETQDMDAELAFQWWKSPLHEWEYDTAVVTGHVVNREPRMTHESYRGSRIGKAYTYPFGFPSVPQGEARDLLLEVGPVGIERKPWWEQAVTILGFWLHDIRAKVKKWEWVGYIGDDEFGVAARAEWDNLTRRLAEAVIRRATELERERKLGEATREDDERIARETKRWLREVMQAYQRGDLRTGRSLDAKFEALVTPRSKARAALDPELLSSRWQPTDILKEFGYEVDDTASSTKEAKQ